MEAAHSRPLQTPTRSRSYQWEVASIEDLATNPEGGFRQRGHFRFFNTTVWNMNLVVRAVASVVPVMAIDLVVFDTNQSPLFDDTLAFNMGLIPLTSTTVDEFVYPEECNCVGACPKCSVRLDLTVACASNLCPVLSGSLYSDNPDIVPVDDEITIVTIAAATVLACTAYARKGTAMKNPKWQVGVAAYFKPLPEIRNAYMLIFESAGQLPVQDVLSRSIEAIESSVVEERVQHPLGTMRSPGDPVDLILPERWPWK